MAGWLQTLETVLRLQGIFSWLAIGSAALALIFGAASYYLSRQALTLREAQLEDEKQSMLSTLEVRQQERGEEQNLRELLTESEKRSEKFLDRIEELQQELEEANQEKEAALAQVAESRRRRVPQAAPPVEQAGAEPEETTSESDRSSTFIGTDDRERFLRAMEGKPIGLVTLIAVEGDQESEKITAELDSLLREAGWITQKISGVFREPPQGLTLVAHSREHMPESAAGLTVGLAIINLISMPAPVSFNPNRPTTYLGIIVVPPQ